MESSWVEVVVTTPADSAEAVTAMLMEAGCVGVAETGGATRRIVGYVQAAGLEQACLDPLRSRLSALPTYGLPGADAPAVRAVGAAEEAGWASEWRKYFRPVEIGKRLVVKPSWETYEPVGGSARLVIEIDPGQAFGTGGHQTTRLCLAALEDYVRPGMVVADIGTGSGILAIAAARLGAATVHATDIDPLPVQVARANVAANGLADVIQVHDVEAFDGAARYCDLIVANILAVTVMELAPSVAGRLRPGGVFISSGYVADQTADVERALFDAGLEPVEVREDEIWRACVSVATQTRTNLA